MKLALYTKAREDRRECGREAKKVKAENLQDRNMLGVRWFAWRPVRLEDTDQLAVWCVVYRRLECSWIYTVIGDCWRPTHYKYYAKMPEKIVR